MAQTIFGNTHLNSSQMNARSNASSVPAQTMLMVKAAQSHGYGSPRVMAKTDHLLLTHPEGHQLAIHSSGSWAHSHQLLNTFGDFPRPVTGQGLKSLTDHLASFHAVPGGRISE